MILNKTIIIDDIQSKFASTGNEGITIVSGKEKYTFYRTIKGQDGEVYKSFKAMEVKPGDVVNIGYTEEDQSFVNAKGETINFTKRSLVGIREGMASQAIPQAEKPHTSHSSAPQRESSEAFGLRLAIHGMVNGLLVSHTPKVVEGMLPELFKLEKAIEERLNKPASLNVAEAKIMPQAKLNESGYIETENINVDDIPF